MSRKHWLAAAIAAAFVALALVPAFVGGSPTEPPHVSCDPSVCRLP